MEQKIAMAYKKLHPSKANTINFTFTSKIRSCGLSKKKNKIIHCSVNSNAQNSLIKRDYGLKKTIALVNF